MPNERLRRAMTAARLSIDDVSSLAESIPRRFRGGLPGAFRTPAIGGPSPIGWARMSISSGLQRKARWRQALRARLGSGRCVRPPCGRADRTLVERSRGGERAGRLARLRDALPPRTASTTGAHAASRQGRRILPGTNLARRSRLPARESPGRRGEPRRRAPRPHPHVTTLPRRPPRLRRHRDPAHTTPMYNSIFRFDDDTPSPHTSSLRQAMGHRCYISQGWDRTACSPTSRGTSTRVRASSVAAEAVSGAILTISTIPTPRRRTV